VADLVLVLLVHLLLSVLSLLGRRVCWLICGDVATLVIVESLLLVIRSTSRSTSKVGIGPLLL